MTMPPIDPIAPAPTTPHPLRAAGRLVLGVAFMALGVWLLYVEMKSAPVQTMLVYLFAGIAMFGAILIDPTYLLTTAQQVVAVALRLLPPRRSDS